MLIACASTLSCAQGKRPFLIVQLCLKDQSGVELFESEMQALAQRERLRYVDGASATERDLKVMGSTGRNMHANGGLIYVAVEGANGFGLEGGNLGLNDFDVAIGFADPEPGEASRQFADRVVTLLKAYWPVSVVPPERGALPDPNCKSNVK
jgi:hypothetical protein